MPFRGPSASITTVLATFSIPVFFPFVGGLFRPVPVPFSGERSFSTPRV